MVEEETKMEPVAEADGIDRLFQERAEQADNAAFLKSARRLRRMTYGGVMILLFLFYIFLPASRVRTVSVQGNTYLSKEYIQELSRCTIDHLYYFLIPPQIAARWAMPRSPEPPWGSPTVTPGPDAAPRSAPAA